MKTQDSADELTKTRIIIEGVALLKKAKRYKQVALIHKLRYLGYELSNALFSNILTNKKVGKDTLFYISEGIQKIVELELGLSWKDGAFVEFIDKKKWEPTIVPGLSLQEPSLITKPGFSFHEDGRLSVQEKVEFLAGAQKEVIEFGLTLNTFVSYFISRRDTEYKSPVEQLLEKGVNFKCFLLSPECNEARLYFEDRKLIAKDELGNIEQIKKSIKKLKHLKKEFDLLGYKGSFEFFTYKHIPYNYFMAIDGSTPRGKMMVSHYIYGIPRAKCPVIEFTKKHNYSLYKKYWNALHLLTKNAKQVSLE